MKKIRNGKQQLVGNCRTTVRIIFFLFLLSCDNPQDQPNVILVITDDQGYGDLACHGNPYIMTPNMDILREESVCLTDYHVSPTCSPTRAALLTGRYNNRTGVWHTITGRCMLREDEVTIAQIFSENGYATGMFGKWHLGDSYPMRPMDRGFQNAVYHCGGSVNGTLDYWDNDYFDDHYKTNGEDVQYEGYCTDVWFTEAMKFIRNNKDKPFFCYLATNAPHWPYFVEDNYSDLYKDNPKVPNPNFYGMITAIDENLGKLREMIEESRLSDNTILIFTTDNGTASGVKLDGHWRDSYPTDVGFNNGMRGIKGSPYEGGHRVPFFMHWPSGGMDKRTDIDALTAHIDIFPTLVDICGLEVPEVWNPDGMSLFGLLKGDYDNIQDRILVTDSQRKLVPEKWRLSSVMTEKWRLVNGEELYDIESDPGQEINIAEQHPDIIENLRASYTTWYNDVFSDWERPSYYFIGDEDHGETVLLSHDWMDPHYPEMSPAVVGDGEERTPWNHYMIRDGILLNGYWDIDIKFEGDYVFEIRRWPRETDNEICSGLPASDMPIPGGEPFGSGKALNIKNASIQIAEIKETQTVNPDDKYARFKISLPAGKTRLKSWFNGDNGLSLGAYYVYIHKAD